LLPTFPAAQEIERNKELVAFPRPVAPNFPIPQSVFGFQNLCSTLMHINATNPRNNMDVAATGISRTGQWGFTGFSPIVTRVVD